MSHILVKWVSSSLSDVYNVRAIVDTNVNIGGGVLVEKTLLERLHSHCNGPTKFARHLLRGVFTLEEMRGKSLFGKGSNANKNAEVKEALDPVRVNAVIARQALLTAVIYTSLTVVTTASQGPGGSGAKNFEPPEKVVNPGESLSIPCFLETPGGSVQWMRNGHPVVLDVGSGGAGGVSRRQWNISRDGTAALTITQVTRADDGLWECREFGDDDSVRRVTKVLKLVVTGAPEEPFLTLGGERLREGSRVTVQEREEVDVGCVARRAVPAVRHMHWMLGETNMTGASQLFVEFSPQEDSYTTRSVLSLNASRDLHGLQLSCHVYHVSWPTSTAVAASLDVLYVPSFSISREPGFGFPILEKMPVSLHCAVDANPPCAPRWLKDDGPPPVPQSPDGYLNFSAIERQHAGWYRCAAVHRLGMFASFGYFLNVR
ncbi:hypothetical protein MRX96_045680, partial [Rhipicephalus microplus]